MCERTGFGSASSSVSHPEILKSLVGLFVQDEVDRATIGVLNRSTLSPIHTELQSYLPVDVDTSPLDNSKSHKEGVSWTYEQFDGYHPIFSYIGREGKQHCPNGTPAYLDGTIALLDHLPITTPAELRLMTVRIWTSSLR